MDGPQGLQMEFLRTSLLPPLSGSNLSQVERLGTIVPSNPTWPNPAHHLLAKVRGWERVADGILSMVSCHSHSLWVTPCPPAQPWALPESCGPGESCGIDWGPLHTEPWPHARHLLGTKPLQSYEGGGN